LEQEGFKFNPYDPCVANRMKNGSQHTIVFHVDDVMSSHVDKKVNKRFARWLEKKYGQHSPVTIHTGKVHDYLGMIFDYSKKGQVEVDMKSYVKDMIESFPERMKTTDIALTAASNDLFEESKGKMLNKEKREIFHKIVAKGLFLSKRARPDILPTIAVLSTRVAKPTESEWNKLRRLIKYLNGTRNKKTTIRAEQLNVIKWYVDVAFAVHPDFKSHTGMVMTMGDGALQAMSRKQKLNTRSSTEGELVGVDDAMTMILWTKLFLEEQGYKIDKNILYQDNKSTILLEENGRRSAGRRSRALNIRYYFVTDQVERKNLQIQYCPTDKMTADFMSKSLHFQATNPRRVFANVKRESFERRTKGTRTATED
jgi:hypothetical protein